ncbi:MAG: sarcosine oxidase subunit gamma [Rhodobacteraceae bacterium]|nr:sarcosine oxidase subunit gamma [Paracoccaceae bacterium]
MSDATDIHGGGGARVSGLADLRATGPQGMIVLRGDLADPGLRTAVGAVYAAAWPGAHGVSFAPPRGLCWMSPDEMLLLGPKDAVADDLAQLTAALGDQHALAVDVSDARCAFALSGPAAREVLAKLTPADLSPQAFGPGRIRRSRLAQVPAAFWMAEDGTTIHIVVFRSVAQYAWDLLVGATDPKAPVGLRQG